MSAQSMTTTLTAHIDDELDEDLETFIDQQEFKPSKAQVVRKALRTYLDEHLVVEE